MDAAAVTDDEKDVRWKRKRDFRVQTKKNKTVWG
jgi:hypothetical protein